MTITTTPALPHIPPSTDYGDITTHIDPSRTQAQRMAGGSGIIEWHQLFSPMHLPGPWSGPIEIVRPWPGSSVGLHPHFTREEIYYVLDGAGWVQINSVDYPITAGNLITCPIGTYHSIGVPADAQEPMTFLVVEMSPGDGQSCPGQIIRMGRLPDDTEGYWDYPDDDLAVATVDLSQRLTGPWGTFAQVTVPADKKIGPADPVGATARLLLTVAGQAEITLGQVTHKAGPERLAVGAVSPVTVRNLSGSEPLRLVTLNVRP